LIGFIAFGIFGIVFRSHLFAIKSVEIEGDKSLLGGSVLHFLEGLKGKSVFAIRPWEIERSLSRIPGIKTARVEKPSVHVVKIILEERKPLAVVKKGKSFTCFDEEGVTIPCWGDGAPLVEIKEREATQPLLEKRELLQEAISLAAVWRDTFDLPLQEIEVVHERLFILRLQNGIVIKCGGVLNLKSKVSLLKPYLREVKIRSIRVIGFDVQAGEDIVIITGESD